MRIRSLLAAMALCGSLALTACTQEATQGSGSGSPYGSRPPGSDTGSSSSGAGMGGGSMGSGGGMR